MNLNLEDYYYHTIAKDSEEEIYNILEIILKDKQLKSQELLGKKEIKYNGLNYISLASYTDISEYKSFIIEENSFKDSKLKDIFNNYQTYLEYMRLDNWLEKPITKEDFFKKNNTDDKREYYKYLDSIARKYPVDISYLYKKTNDEIYKDILDIVNNDIVYCDKSENCFDEYIKESKGVTFIFPKTINIEKVTIIPNLPFDVEDRLVNKVKDYNKRYSNQIGEVQVRDKLALDEAIGIIVADRINVDKINKLLKVNEYNLDIFRINGKKLVKIV